MKKFLILSDKELKFLKFALGALHGDLTFGDVNYKQREVDLKYARQLTKKIEEALSRK